MTEKKEMMLKFKPKKVLVTGSTGFLGKEVVRKLIEREIDYCVLSRGLGTDLRSLDQTQKYFDANKPDVVLNCAAYVGGIQFGYKHFAEIFENNLLMTINLNKVCRESGILRIVNPISNCAYPAKAKLFREEEFWDGPLHESVLVYGFVRKASWVGAFANNYQHGLDTVSLILSNMYGPGDHFDEERSHALGALIKKFVEAKENNYPSVVVWGTGKPVREWMYVGDAAEVMVRSIWIEKNIDPINIGIGQGISIADMAKIIKDKVGYEGQIVFDESKPDGADYKTVEGSKGARIFNWSPEKKFIEGIEETVKWYLKNKN